MLNSSEIKTRIFSVRGFQVMLDSHLAEIYQVETKNLNKAVSRNIDRFPETFQFQLSKEEWEILKFQIGTSSEKHGGRRYLPYVFTEQGVAMLSSLIKTPFASLKDLGKKWFAFPKMNDFTTDVLKRMER